MGELVTFHLRDTILGSIYFPGLRAARQLSAYGVDYRDCVSYGPDSADDECFGHPRSKDVNGKYRPRVARGVRRCESLLEKIRAKAVSLGRPRAEGEEAEIVELLRLLRAAEKDAAIRVTFSG